MTARMKIEVRTYERLQAAENELRLLRGEGTRERRKVLGQVLDVFGLREAYPDKTMPSKQFNPLTGFVQEFEDIVLGVDKFASDLGKAAAASVGDSALKTIRKAIKEATK